MFSVDIDFHKVNSIPYLITMLEPLFKILPGESVRINIDFSNTRMVFPEYLAVIVGLVRHLKLKGININTNVNNPKDNNYIARINFYRELGITSLEPFNRYNSSGRFVEITPFDGSTNIKVTNDIMKVIKMNCNINQQIYKCLNYCLFEVVDNVENHSQSPIGGYAVVQNYRFMKELRLIILDTGRGIYESLTNTPGTKYSHLTPEESLTYCIKKEVTNGLGKGNGLFHTSEFIKNNMGELLIYSGNNYLEIMNGESNICKGSYWQGTLIYIKINTHNIVDLVSIFGEDIPETVTNAEEYIFDDFELW